MREPAEKALKIACWVLAALLLYQLGQALVRTHPFAQVSIPAMPAWSPATNAAAGGGPAGAVPVSARGAPTLRRWEPITPACIWGRTRRAPTCRRAGPPNHRPRTR